MFSAIVQRYVQGVMAIEKASWSQVTAVIRNIMMMISVR
jgi:hypothetical protein